MYSADSQAPQKTILVVDDDASIRDTVEIVLSSAGYSVLTAENGRAAFEILCTTQVDAVVTDLRMDEGDGFELLQRIRLRDPKAPLVFILSGEIPWTDDRILKQGASAFFEKPCDPYAMVEAIARCL